MAAPVVGDEPVHIGDVDPALSGASEDESGLYRGNGLPHFADQRFSLRRHQSLAPPHPGEYGEGVRGADGHHERRGAGRRVLRGEPSFSDAAREAMHGDRPDEKAFTTASGVSFLRVRIRGLAEFVVDWETMLEKTIRQPISRIIEALGWEWADVDSLRTNLSQWGGSETASLRGIPGRRHRGRVPRAAHDRKLCAYPLPAGEVMLNGRRSCRPTPVARGVGNRLREKPDDRGAGGGLCMGSLRPVDRQ